jgi:hypothetical protein
VSGILLSKDLLRQTRQLEREAAEERARQAHIAETQTIPMRVLELNSQCRELGIDTRVSSKDGVVTAGYHYPGWGGWINIRMGAETSDPWEVSVLEDNFARVRQARQEEAQERELAKTAASKLTPEELTALLKHKSTLVTTRG